VLSNATNSPITVTVSGSGAVNTVSVAVSPASATLASGQTQQFTASVSGSSNTNVTWTVQGGGTISTSGLFTAPQVLTNTTVLVTATGVADSTKTASATLTVTPAITAVINVASFGATGNGTTDDTVAINAAIGALQAGNELFFPCGTYKVSSSLIPITVNKVIVDGQTGCVGGPVTIHGTGGLYIIMQIGNGGPGAATALTANAGELATTFSANFANIGGLNAGDHVLLQEGGRDYSTDTAPGHDTGCDVSGCRGEVLEIQSVNGNVATVTTALHFPYDPVVNAATIQKLVGVVDSAYVHDLQFDGSLTLQHGLYMKTVTNSTVANISITNFLSEAALSYWSYNLAWNNITITNSGNYNYGSDIFTLVDQGNASVNGMTLSSYPGSNTFGFGLHTTANGTYTNVTSDKANSGTGRACKIHATSYSTFNALTCKNSTGAYNGIILNYYSSHNTFNNCVIINNAGGIGSGNAGINLFGNFNRYNTFSNCTVTGNGNVQVFDSYYDALRLGADSNNAFIGGTYTGSNSVQPVFILEAPQDSISGATINGPGRTGIEMDAPSGTAPGAPNACINNNTFDVGTGLSGAIFAAFSSDIGSGNILNGLSSNLTPGTCR